MANNPHFSLVSRNNMLDEINAELGSSALFQLYAGVQPADVSAVTTAANVVVATLAFTESSAFAVASSGSMAANAITDDTSAAGGSANWFSLVKTTGTRVADGEVGTTGSDLNLNSQTIATGATVSVSAFTITIPA